MGIRKRTRAIMPAVAVMVCVGGVLTAGEVSAASVHTSTSKVQRHQRREAGYEARLEQAVSNKKLTSTQEQAVLAEHNVLKGELRAATKASRKQVRAQVRQEAQTWAQQNHLPVRLLGLGFGRGKR